MIAPLKTKLDSDGCLINTTQQTDKKSEWLNGTHYCVSASSEGTAGSSYRTYDYTNTLGIYVVSLEFQIHYLNSNRVVAGCETDADQLKQTCKDLVFNEKQDTALFDQIAETFAGDPNIVN